MDIIRWLATEPGWLGRCGIMATLFAALEIPLEFGAPAMLALGMIDPVLFPKARR